jgi:hypothetical protein
MNTYRVIVRRSKAHSVATLRVVACGRAQAIRLAEARYRQQQGVGPQVCVHGVVVGVSQ